ncbi:hypothetical protein AVEN_79789-1 [Araneus ventricosus]|uniref:Uncharacterized protein n=1 Tax=Araneus ventricosus TaxID=182803 RepID=A0A4Y2G245_ARAVE|nr:hypothetical protein AVEN_79789-1 [Araneus ventricosus]
MRKRQRLVTSFSGAVSAVDERIWQNRRITTREIAVELSMSKGTVHHLIHKKLGNSKVYTQWVPKHLSENQKTARWELDLSAIQSFYTEANHSLPYALRDQCINANGNYLKLYCST